MLYNLDSRSVGYFGGMSHLSPCMDCHSASNSDVSVSLASLMCQAHELVLRALVKINFFFSVLTK